MTMTTEAVTPKRAAKAFTPPPGLKPGALDKASAAWYVSLSESSLERGVREGWFPKPRQLSGSDKGGRAAYLVSELDDWLANRPVSSLPPPPNTGHSNRKRAATSAG